MIHPCVWRQKVSEQNYSPGGFPLTRNSAIVALKQGDPEQRKIALARVIEIYRPAVYKYLRLHWRKDQESAADLTQSFFLLALEKEFLADFDPAKARFRTFLRLCLDRFVGKEQQSASRIKRGGDSHHLSMDFDFIERDLIAPRNALSLSPEELFEQEWIRNLLSTAVTLLKKHYDASGKSVHFNLFERYDLQSLDSNEKASYQELAAQYMISTETVTNYLAAARRDFRRIVLDQIREMTASDEEYREEVRSILGVDL